MGKADEYLMAPVVRRAAVFHPTSSSPAGVPARGGSERSARLVMLPHPRARLRLRISCRPLM